MAEYVLDFEKPVVDLEKRLDELKRLSKGQRESFSVEISQLEAQVNELKKDIYANLSAWQRVLLSRHPERPHTRDYIDILMTGFTELHGDYRFRDDPAMIGGPAFLDGAPVMVIGQEKGRGVREKVACNFGSPHPEGYRKALRMMKMAEKFGIPVITFIDTQGAYPGVGAEERGQAWAIAENLREMSRLPVPIICVNIGEGGSGGALAIGVGDRVLMMENAWYSVISPEGCASILYKDAAKAAEAAESLKLTADGLLELGLIDGIIKEPLGGAHRDHEEAAQYVKTAVLKSLSALRGIPADELVRQRYARLRGVGVYA